MKPRVIIVILLLLALVAVSSWFLYRDDIREAIGPKLPETPDYTLDNFVLNNYTKQGVLEYRISGVYMEHLPHLSSFNITGLDYHAFEKGRLSWEASAQRATMEEESQVINLAGGVDIRYYSAEERIPVRMQTEAMTVYAKRDYAQNSRPTDIQFKDGRFKSRGGFQIDGKAKTLKMFGGVSGEMKHE